MLATAQANIRQAALRLGHDEKVIEAMLEAEAQLLCTKRGRYCHYPS